MRDENVSRGMENLLQAGVLVRQASGRWEVKPNLVPTTHKATISKKVVA